MTPKCFTAVVLRCCAAIIAVASPLNAQDDTLVVVEGVVRDSLSDKPIPFVIVRVAGTGRSTLTTGDGRYSIRVPQGEGELQFRKIGYRMASMGVPVPGELDVRMSPLPIALAPVTVTGEYENPAIAIIRQAIARKNDLLSRIHDYRYTAYVKFVIRDLKKDGKSSESIVLLTETLTSAYWEQPDRYQETITARRQSRNLEAESNFVSVGEIANFNRDRLDLEKYSVVSPTADDALDSYDYQIVDTLWDGTQMIYRLAIEPNSETKPLFVGMIDIADSTFDVRVIDVGVNQAVRFEFVKNLRYRQQMARVGPDAWMPTEIRLSGEIHIGIPIPDFPSHFSFVHLASLRDFRFDEGQPPRGLGEYLVMVDEAADDADSSVWADRRTPLSANERAAWTRIDSLENLPASFGANLADGALGTLVLAANHDFFHFNRVEGAYLGAGVTLRDLSPDIIVRAKTGYAFDADRWQYHYGARYRVSEDRRLWIGASYRDEIVQRPTMVSGRRNSTSSALLGKVDPMDYSRERGWVASANLRLIDFVRFSIQYNDFEQTPVDIRNDYAIFKPNKLQRPNPPIVSGRLRSVSGSLRFDSRRRAKQKGRDYFFNAFTYTQVTLGAEYTSPDLIGSDFDFFRFYVRLYRRQRSFNLGITTIDAVAGASSGNLPPQRYFTVDFGDVLFFEEGGFNTLNETNFSGNRAAMLVVSHDFDQQIFRRSHVPGLRALPFTLGIHGGVFWTDFVNHTPNPGDALVFTASSAYGELGFRIGNLTPFISPFNFSAWFTWQVSDRGTDRFNFAIGVPRL